MVYGSQFSWPGKYKQVPILPRRMSMGGILSQGIGESGLLIFFYLKFEFLVKFAIIITEEHQVETNRGFTKGVMAVDRTWGFISQEWYFSPPGRMQRQERGSEDPVLHDTSASHWTEELPVDVMPDASSLKRTERSWWALKSTHRADEGKRRHLLLLATKG